MASGVPLLAPRAAPGLYGDVNVDGRWFKVRSICGEGGPDAEGEEGCRGSRSERIEG